jgi:multimeric flavodoxin WrbA
LKILSIVSSHRKSGNTARLIRCIENELQSTARKENVPLELETIFLGHADIQLCRGCRLCFDKGEEMCPLKDELLFIRDKIQQADGIILASPIYVDDINGIMKNWIDRMAFNCHRPAFAGKKAIVLATSGSYTSKHALNTLNTALNTWGFKIVGKNKFCTGDIMSIEEIKNLYSHKIKNAADRLFYAINKGNCVIASFYSLLAFRIQQKHWQKNMKTRTSFDYLFWEGKGWLNKDCDYYIEHNTNRIKVKFARSIANILLIFLK